MAQFSVKVEIDEEKFQEMIEEFKKNNPDFVEVVRCKDCMHRGTNNCPMHCKGVPANEDFLKKVDDDFCSYGEKKNKNTI